MKVTFLVSGNGDNYVLKALHSIKKWDITVVGFDENCTGLTYAKKNKIQYTVIKEGNNRDELTSNIISAINEINPKAIILLFHRLLGKAYFNEIKIPTFNIHPAILPSFSGFRAIDKAITHGVKITGVTLHLVDESEDGGPILIQAIQPISQKVNSYQDLLPNLNKLYCLCAIQCLTWLEQNRIELKDNKTIIKNALFNQSNIYPNIEEEVYKLESKITIL